MKHVGTIVAGALRAYETREENRKKGIFTGVPSGFVELDGADERVARGQFIVIRGTPGDGENCGGVADVEDRGKTRGFRLYVFPWKCPTFHLLTGCCCQSVIFLSSDSGAGS